MTMPVPFNAKERTAIETKIDDQAEFVRWWKETVQSAGRKWDNSPRSALITGAAAESLTGIKHQQVSRWAKSLKDRDAYGVSHTTVANDLTGNNLPKTGKSLPAMPLSIPPGQFETM